MTLYFPDNLSWCSNEECVHLHKIRITSHLLLL